MRTVFAYPGTMADARNAAIALADAGVLDAYVTTFAWRRNGFGARAIRRLPQAVSMPVLRQLERRTIDGIAEHKVHRLALWEMLRTAANRYAGPVAADRIWDRMSRSFDATVARRYVPKTQAIHGFEYTSLQSFEAARQAGVARVLHLPSLDSRQFELIQEREKRQWPELRSPHDAYFDSMFERRYERRQREIALADVIVVNSSLTARSHIAAGAAADKVICVPLAAPPPVEQIVERETDGPLAVLWAGPFSLRKGAHYAIDAWRSSRLGRNARLDVYGHMSAPARLLDGLDESVRFHGSVPQTRLFEAYRNADVLLFPTLSDGFGLVAAEALAHGLPVITTEQAGAADLISQDNGLIVPAADPQALAQALRWCLDNRTRLAEMRHHALETAHRRQWTHYRRDYVTALDGALRRAGYAPRYDVPTENQLIAPNGAVTARANYLG